ncbi:MAG TPA: VOC family protein [Caldimonas sp.]|nr:VOC family protein [Caldimonas sp.]
MSGGAAAPAIALDHLVVACRSLGAGRAWCEATFGVAPAPGGRHPLMGTHNLLLALASARFPKAYLELIAIDPDAPAPAQPRWFDLDDSTLQAAIAEPRLVHWVARSVDIEATVAALRRAGHDPGRIAAAERMTPGGVLRWRITLADDGRRPMAGAMPLWIQWSGPHPTEAMPASGVTIESIRLGGVGAELAGHVDAIAQSGDGSSPLVAVLVGPNGRVTLAAPAPAPPGAISA